MKRYIIILLIANSLTFLGQAQTSKIQLTKREYQAFPFNIDTLTKVKDYYVQLLSAQPEYLANESQKAIAFYYSAGSFIDFDEDNGVLNFLLKTTGVYNTGFLNALRVSENEDAKEVFEEVINLFERHKGHFLNKELPPALDENSKKFDSQEYQMLGTLQRKWSDNEKARYQTFFNYLADIKDDLIVIKQ